MGLSVTLVALISVNNCRLQDVNCITNIEIFLDRLYSCYRRRGFVKVGVHSSALPWQLEPAGLESVAAPSLCFARCVSKRWLGLLFDVPEFLSFSHGSSSACEQ